MWRAPEWSRGRQAIGKWNGPNSGGASTMRRLGSLFDGSSGAWQYPRAEPDTVVASRVAAVGNAAGPKGEHCGGLSGCGNGGGIDELLLRCGGRGCGGLGCGGLGRGRPCGFGFVCGFDDGLFEAAAAVAPQAFEVLDGMAIEAFGLRLIAKEELPEGRSVGLAETGGHPKTALLTAGYSRLAGPLRIA